MYDSTLSRQGARVGSLVGLVSDGVVQREPGGHGTTKTTGDKGHGDPEVTGTREHERASPPSVRESRHEATHDKGQDR